MLKSQHSREERSSLILTPISLSPDAIASKPLLSVSLSLILNGNTVKIAAI
ncbi:MAG: hypothetical protein AB1589_06905 [Cyanobacteriota bacterium]